MKSAQSPRDNSHSAAVPSPGEKPGLRDLGWLIGYTLRGFCWLVRSAYAFRTFAVSGIPDRNQTSVRFALAKNDDENRHIARISYVLPRISKRVPWRSDCLIQAMAAQDWLASSNLASELKIGVEKPESGSFAAHAWLVHGEIIVTGGDITRYAAILANSMSDTQKSDPIPGDRASDR